MAPTARLVGSPAANPSKPQAPCAHPLPRHYRRVWPQVGQVQSPSRPETCRRGTSSAPWHWRKGVGRPFAIEHSNLGLSTKVLNQRLRKLTHFGVLDRSSFPELPPRVVYQLTRFGDQFVRVLDQIAALRPHRAPTVGGSIVGSCGQIRALKLLWQRSGNWNAGRACP